MATKNSRTQSIVLLPIHPQYAKRILAGQKRVEFRRVRFARDVSHVVIYATSPIKRIVGYFEVSEIVRASPTSLWRAYKKSGGIDRETFSYYFAAKRLGYAIGVKSVWSLAQPKSLRVVGPFKTPPQSFAYLPHHYLGRLKTASVCKVAYQKVP